MISLQGQTIELCDDDARIELLEKAFDFRGDCTLTLTDGTQLTGYIFDRRRGATSADSYVRLLPEQGDDKARVSYAQIAKVLFHKDTAHGRTFEAWVKRYVEKKRKGEAASIEAETL